MKYPIIIGLLAIFALLGTVSPDECVPFPKVLIDHLVLCGDVISSASLQELFSVLAETVRDTECYAFCLYNSLGYFQNGQFSMQFIENFLRTNVPHSAIEQLVALTRQLADKANAVEGNFCEKAYEFFIMRDAKELVELQQKVFCVPELPDHFVQRIAGNVTTSDEVSSDIHENKYKFK